MIGSILLKMDKICLVIFILAAVEELAFCWPLRFYPFPYYYQNEDYAGKYFNEIIKRSPALPWENSLPRARYHDTSVISSLQSYQHLPHFPASDDLVSVFVPDNPQQNSIHNDITNVWYYQPSYSNGIPSSNLVFPSATEGTSTRSHNIGFTRKPSNRIPAVTDSFGMMKTNSQSYSRKNSNFLPSSTTVRTSVPSNNVGFTRKPTNENFPSVTDSAKLIEWDTINDQERKEMSSQANSLVSTRSDFMTKRWSWIIPVTSTDRISDEISISKRSTLNSSGTNSIPSLTTPQINVDWRQLVNDNETEVTEYEKFTTNSITEGSIVRHQVFSDSRNETDIKVSSDMTTTPYSIETSTSKNFVIDVTERNLSKSDETTLVSEKNNINQTIIESDRLYTAVVVKMTSVSGNRTDFSTDSYVTEAPFRVEADDFRLFTSSANDETTQVSERVIDRTILESEHLETTEVNKITAVSGNETDFSTDSSVSEVLSKAKTDDFKQFTFNANDETTQVSEKIINDTITKSDRLETTEVSNMITVFENQTDSSTTEIPLKIEADDFRLSTFNPNQEETTPISGKTINRIIIESDDLNTTEVNEMTIVPGNETNFTMNFVEMEEFIAGLNGTDETIRKPVESIVDWPVISISDPIDRRSIVELKNLTFDAEESSGAGELEQFRINFIEFMKSETDDFDNEWNINAVDCKEFMFSITPKSGSTKTRFSSPSTTIDNLKKSTSRST